MAANAISWPPLLIPRQASFQIDVPSRSGGLSMTGSEQVTVSAAGRWKARLDVPLARENRILAMRGLLAQLEGRAGTVLVPKWERYGPRDANGKRMAQLATAGYENCGLNADLSAFGQDEFDHAELASSAAAGSTQISVTLAAGIDGPRPGQYFGVGQRLYLCQSVWQEEEGDPLQVQFTPRLREAGVSGDRVILDRPVCLMRLADDDSGNVMLDRGLFGTATFDFVEAI
jgi:hypothetical protein